MKIRNLILLTAVISIAGCANPKAIPYQATAAVIVSGETALREYNAYVKTLPVQNIAENQAVAAAYAKYQSAMEVVADAGATYQAAIDAAGSTNSVSSAVLDQAVQTANQDLTDLDNLITSFGVKL